MKSPRKISSSTRQYKYKKARDNARWISSSSSLFNPLSNKSSSIWNVPSSINTENLWNTPETYVAGETSNETKSNGNPPPNRKNMRSLSDSLRIWALIRRIPLIALTEMLHILEKFGCNVPLDGRTLLGTPTSVMSLLDVFPGHYYHHGIIDCIKRRLEILESKEGFIDSLEPTLTCYINTDGLPLAQSNSNCFWPIQVLISALKNYLFVCDVYYK
jgi:hypothetical protein